jgi:serine protease Do
MFTNQKSKISAAFFILFLFASCRSADSPRQAENKSLRDSVKALVDSLAKYRSAQTSPGARNIVPLKELYKKLKSAVFLIYTVDNQDTAQGSGFFVDSSGIAISNYHVFESAGHAIAETDDGNKYPISQILAYDEDKDYVIFRVGGGESRFNYVKKSSKDVEVGDDCFAVGNPQGLTQTLSTGIISGIRFEGKIIQTTTQITFGSSGGPLFNGDGEVLGITSGGMGEADLNFCVNIAQIPYEKFLTPGSAIVPPLPDDIGSEIKEHLTAYFKTLTDQRFDSTKEFFTQNLFRFYSKFNVSNEDAAKYLEEDWRKSKITTGRVKINWNSLKIERSLWGYEVKLNADYFLVREEKTKPSHFNLDMIIEFNHDMLIQSMYENILARS